MSRAGDCSLFLTNYLRNRELGGKVKLGSTDKFMEKLYSHLLPCTVWNHNDWLRNSAPGGIFNLEFSPDGSLLVAACERRSILLFDPICRKLVNSVDNAHFDCVNCVRFLDSRVFATCSDDSTVALWDARNLKSRIRTLHGHSNWVKNIEYSQSDGLLVTSGFDGVIYTWDINSYTESGFLYNRVFHTNGLMRTRLTPDASKMIICTTGGFLILIHDLNLRTLANDLYGFKPNMYRLMQLSQTTIPIAASFTHLFSKRRKQNRIEFVTDFPEGDDAEVLSSLQVHPQGWCALSRNISNDETSEWTCVHDIQDLGSKDDTNSEDQSEESDCETESQSSPPPTPPLPLPSSLITRGSGWYVMGVNGSGVLHSRGLRRQNAIRGFRGSSSLSNHSTAGSSIANASSTRSTGGSSTTNSSSSRFTGGSLNNSSAASNADSSSSSGNSSGSAPRNNVEISSTDVWEALVAIREARARRQARNNENQNNSQQGGERREVESRLRIVRMQSGLDGFSHPSQDNGPLERERHVYRQSSHYISLTGPPLYIMNRPRISHWAPKVPKNHKIHQNVPRLTHYIEESNVGKGFIKELCFSSDGRLICSPFGYGVRLLTFSPNCTELSSCVPKEGPVKLHELGTNVSHHDIVVSTKFSPTHCLLVSGCLTGRIVWHQPVL